MARRFGGLSARSQSAVLALLTLAVLLGAWHAWLSPERLLLDSRRSRRDLLVTEIARLHSTAAGLPRLRREIKELETRFSSTDTPESDTLLDAIHELATQSGLELINFTLAPAAGEAKSGAARVQLGLDGRFHETVAFLARLSASGRLASVPELTIAPHAKPTSRRTVAVGIVVEVRPAATSTALADVVSGFEQIDSRDPFLPPSFGIASGAGDTATAAMGSVVAAGLNGISANDVTVTGVVRAGHLMTAILQAPDRRTFVVKPQDQLLDATVKQVDEAGVVFAVRPPRDGPPQSVELRKTLARLPGVRR